MNIPSEPKFLFTAAMDVPHYKEVLFDKVYDQEHIPHLSQVPWIISIVRFTTRSLNMVLGGRKRKIVIEGQPKHTAIYKSPAPRFFCLRSGPKRWIVADGPVKYVNIHLTGATYYYKRTS